MNVYSVTVNVLTLAHVILPISPYPPPSTEEKKGLSGVVGIILALKDLYFLTPGNGIC